MVVNMGLLLFPDKNQTYYDQMEKFVTVFRNPLRTTLAEFNRRRFGQQGTFKTLRQFRQAAGRKTNNDNYKTQNFQTLYELQTDRGFSLQKSMDETGKPILVLSYEDIQRNLLSQLLRILLFFGLGDNMDYWHRAICTCYNEFRNQRARRVYTFNMEQAATYYLNKTKFLNDLQLFDQSFRAKRLHFLRIDEYMSTFK